MLRAPRRQEHWCPLPWVAVETTPNGESRVCCLSNTLITKDDGTDMTVYGEALGASRWQKGARLKIAAQPVRTSKTGKQYQTASSIELLDGEVAVPNGNIVSARGVQQVKDVSAQWKEKYRLTMSNLMSAWLSSGKEVTPEIHKNLDLIVRDILNSKMDSVDDLQDDPPF